MKHTKGKLEYDDESVVGPDKSTVVQGTFNAILPDGKRVWVASICLADLGPNRLDSEIEEADANAARIVACVNACEGINPESVKDMKEALENALSTFISQWSASQTGPRELVSMRTIEHALRKAREGIE